MNQMEALVDALILGWALRESDHRTPGAVAGLLHKPWM